MNAKTISGNGTHIQHGRFPLNGARPLDHCDEERRFSTGLGFDDWLAEVEAARPLFEDQDARSAWEHVS